MSAISIKLSGQGEGASRVTKIESGTFQGAFLLCSLNTVSGALTAVRSSSQISQESSAGQQDPRESATSWARSKGCWLQRVSRKPMGPAEISGLWLSLDKSCLCIISRMQAPSSS